MEEEGQFTFIYHCRQVKTRLCNCRLSSLGSGVCWRGGMSLIGVVVCRWLARWCVACWRGVSLVLLAWWCVTGSIGVVMCRWLAWWCVGGWRGGVSLVGVVVCHWFYWRGGVSVVGVVVCRWLAWWCVGGWRGGVSLVGVVVCRWLAWWCVAGWRGDVLLVGVVTCCWLARLLPASSTVSH